MRLVATVGKTELPEQAWSSQLGKFCFTAVTKTAILARFLLLSARRGGRSSSRIAGFTKRLFLDRGRGACKHAVD